MPVNSFDNYPMSWKPKINKNDPAPLYIKIYEDLEQHIRQGFLKPNDKLPPQRELADYLDVNLCTVARAFKLCSAKGLICGERGRGTYISADVLSNIPMLDENGLDKCINLGASHPLYEHNSYIEQSLKHLLKKKNMCSILEYCDTSGRKSHRSSGSQWLEHFGLHVAPEKILVTSGLQNSIAIILSSLFKFGDKILTNSLIYPGLKNIANSLGIILLPIPYHEKEISLHYINQLCKTENIKGIYLIPDHHNPTTITMSERERIELSLTIKRNHLLCIEDGTYSFLLDKPLPSITSLIPEQSIYISSLSNSISPGLRIAFLTMPPKYELDLIKGNSNINVMASQIESEIASFLIDNEIALKIIQEKRQSLRKRNQITESYLSKFDLWGDRNSQFRWLNLPKKWTGKDFEKIAQENGVQVFSCERFIVGNASVKPGIRISISTPKDLNSLERGIGIIHSLL